MIRIVLISSYLIIALAILVMIPLSSVYASGVRHDSGDDATLEESHCWISGYDSGFAGKYDKDRALDCIEHSDNYNQMWAMGCEDAPSTEKECSEIMNNPVKIEDYEELENEINAACFNDGQEDGKSDKPFNKDRDSGCDEYSNRYGEGYQFGCETDTTQASCELLIAGEDRYYPDHPDIVACIDFLHNATNKKPESPYSTCAGMVDPREFVICPQESSPEKYCLMTDNPTFCKTIGDLCDADGFVKPEYPYCS